jgi:uncharacterized delta-60 repeat protein
MFTYRSATLTILSNAIFSLTLTLSISTWGPISHLTEHPPFSLNDGYHGYLPIVLRSLDYHESTGLLDPDFGSNGIVTTDFANDEFGYAVALQPDGKILVAGYMDIPFSDYFALARYNPDGSLDQSFSDDGKVITGFGNIDEAHAIVLQPDGKIILAGDTSASPGIPEFDFALERYNPDGSLDKSFGSDGMVITDFYGGLDAANAITLQPDGKIIAAGVGESENCDFALARYNPDGSLDTSFGSDGKVTTDFSGEFDEVKDIVLQPDGKIVVIGFTGNISHEDFALARYNQDGSLDLNFNGNGKVRTNFGGTEYGFGVALQADGKIIVVGEKVLPYYHDYDSYWVLARYNPDGSLDPNFDGDGRVTTNFGNRAEADAVTLQSDGKIIVAGSTEKQDSIGSFGVARYNTDGSLDINFGDGGRLTTDIGSTSFGTAVVLQPDGKIVVAGYTANGSDYDFALVRYK